MFHRHTVEQRAVILQENMETMESLARCGTVDVAVVGRVRLIRCVDALGNAGYAVHEPGERIRFVGAAYYDELRRRMG